MRRTVFLIVYLVWAVSHTSAEDRLVFQSGHDGEPVDIQWHRRTQTLVSAGEDGRFIVYDPEMKIITHRFKVTDGPIYQFQSDPSGDRAAFLTINAGRYNLSVWDWGEEKKLYDLNLDSAPLFFTWSARGAYLAVGKITSPSLLLINGKQGHLLPYIDDLPYLFDSGYIGSTEQTMMTYTSTGDIRYWNIRNSSLRLSVKTLPNLVDLAVLQIEDKSILLARKGKVFYLIHRQSGKILDQMIAPGPIVDFAVDSVDGALDILSSSSQGALLHQYTLRGGMFKMINEQDAPLPLTHLPHPLRITRGNRQVFAAAASGSLASISDGAASVIADNITWQPQALTFIEDNLYIGGNNQIWRFNSPFFSLDSSIRLDDLTNHTSQLITIGASNGEMGLGTLPDGRIISWFRDGTGSEQGIRISDPHSIDSGQSIDSTGPIARLKIIDDSRIMTIDQNGMIGIINYQTGKILSKYSALGILDAVYSATGDFILTGKSSSYQSPLGLIDMSTQESMQIPDDRFMVYHININKESIYTIGVKNLPLEGTLTVLMSHRIENLKQSFILKEFQGEDIRAKVIPRKQGKGVHTNLGGELIKILGSRKTAYKWPSAIRDFDEYGAVLYGIDAEGSLVFWDVADGTQALLRVSFFKDGSLIAYKPNGRALWASHTAQDNFILFRGGKIVSPQRMGILQHVTPKDSIPEEIDAAPKDSIPEEIDAAPKDSIPEEIDVTPKDSIPEEIDVTPKDSIPEEIDVTPKDSIPEEIDSPL